MARGPNSLKTVTVTISTTPHIKEYLRKLVMTGLYGKNEAEAAERLVARGIERLIGEGALKKRRAA